MELVVDSEVGDRELVDAENERLGMGVAVIRRDGTNTTTRLPTSQRCRDKQTCWKMRQRMFCSRCDNYVSLHGIHIISYYYY